MQFGGYKSEKLSRTNTVREIQIGRIPIGKQQPKNKHREIQLGKIPIGKSKS